MTDSVEIGELVELAPGIRRLTAPNPGPMTGPGTNSYIVGDGPYAVIDPGVDDDAHLERLVAACEGQLTTVLLTHRHPDHAAGAAQLAEQTGAMVRAQAKATLGDYDLPVVIDQPLADGETLAFGGVSLRVLHTPGHAADHLCFLAEDSGLLFAGDSIMADVTVVILPPDGVMQDYMATLARLAELPIRRIAPGHGRMLDEPQSTIGAIVAHRREREAQVLAAVPAKADIQARTIAEQLYPELDRRLLPMAGAQVTAHLISLASQGEVVENEQGWRQRAR